MRCVYMGFACRGVCVSVHVRTARSITVREKEEGKECHSTQAHIHEPQNTSKKDGWMEGERDDGQMGGWIQTD